MNFNELAAKLKAIDECGEMPMQAMPHPMTPPPQQDSVSMNVSMNAQGKGGIKDLMDVLRQIETGGSVSGAGDMPIAGEPHQAHLDIAPDELEIDTEPHGAEVDAIPGMELHAEPEMDVDGHDDLGLDQEPEGEHDPIAHGDIIRAAAIGSAKPEAEKIITDKLKSGEIEVDEAHAGYSNRPDVSHQGIDYMTKDLSGGLNKQHKQNKRNYRGGDNVMAVSEGLKGRLRSLYNEVKSR